MRPTTHLRPSRRAPAAVLRRLGTLGVLALSLALVACEGSPTTEAPGGPITTSTPASVNNAALGATPTPTPTPSPTPTPEAQPGEEPPLYDDTLVRNDVDCSRDFVASGGGEAFPDAFVSTHYVVDGVLGAVCLGDEDPRLLEAWRWLRVVAPAEDLQALVLLAGFDTQNDLLAYVEALLARDGSTAFQMTVNLREAERDEVELALTMAHEFTHIFTATADQLDREAPPDACETYHDGEGCYRPGSFLAVWADAFWDEWIEDLVPGDESGAGARCQVNASFLGSYAATNPEEDFAETFSAWVYAVPVDSPELAAKYEFLDGIPELRIYRERVQQFGFEPLPNQFEGCGLE